MVRARLIPAVLASLTTLCAMSGCRENPVGPDLPRIIPGESHELGSEVVSSSGATVRLDLPGDSLDGLTIDIPAGAYSDARTFRISAASVQSHEFGPDFNPLTPLIAIENGGGYSREPMELTIPCTVPEGHFAMAFLYDRSTGRIEGMPVADLTDTSVTVLTYNFDFSKTAAAAKGTGWSGTSVQVGSSEVVVSSIPEAKLNEPSNSGFVPGVDDWQFPNYGSSISPGGHCAGQSTTMMWYYSARKQNRGDEPLYGRFDNDGASTTPKIWEDDVAGYRFCGLAQVDLPWNSILRGINVNMGERLPESVTYNLFAYAMRLTKQPQYIRIVPEDPNASGHAMVVYKAVNGILSIADPNYPAKSDRPVEFSFGRFLPYYSGPNASDVGVKYTKFQYMAQSAMIDHGVIARHWSTMFDETIGSDRYPSYSIHGRDGDGMMSPLIDGFVTASGILELDVRNSDVPLKIHTVYDVGENVVPFSDGRLQLRFGEHLLGFYITTLNNEWVGFNWIRVESKNDATDPVDIPPSETGSDCSAFFRIDGTGTSVTWTRYEKFDNGMFRFLGDFPGGSARMTIGNFGGPGTYQLYRTESFADGGSFVVYHNGNSWAGDGTMTITRFDAEKVAGTFVFENKNGSGQTVKQVTGEFQCNR